MKSGLPWFLVPLLLAGLIMLSGVMWLGQAVAAKQSPVRTVASTGFPVLDLPAPDQNGAAAAPIGTVQFLQKLSPADRSVVTTPRPTIFAEFNAKLLGTVDAGSVCLLVNGQDVTDKAFVNIADRASGGNLSSYIRYTPSQDLPEGTTSVFIKCTSGQHFPGRVLQQKGSFLVHADGNPLSVKVSE